MHRFETTDDVQSTLQKLMQRKPPLVKVLPRQPGTKESRWVHLLAGDVVVPEAAPARMAANQGPDDRDRVRRLEVEVDALRNEVAELRGQLDKFRRQFE